VKRLASFFPVLLGTVVAMFAIGCSPAPHAAAPTVAASEPAPAPPTSLEAVAAAPAETDSESEFGSETQLGPPTRGPDVIFVPTPHEVVDEMLATAGVGPEDVLYDLGSGDGRIPITAAQRFGTRGVGIDIDPQRIREANRAAERAGVTDKVEFIEADLFETDLSDATVISLYLLPSLNLKLRPKLLQLKPGTRIVSHNYDMGDWQPEQTKQVGSSTVYFWTVPETRPAHLR